MEPTHHHHVFESSSHPVLLEQDDRVSACTDPAVPAVPAQRATAAERVGSAERPAAAQSWRETMRARAAEQRGANQALAVELKAQGWTNRQIAARLGASIGHVETLRREAGDTDHTRVTPIDPRVRVERAREALALQRSGLTRREIGATMGCSIEGVKAILADGRFHEDPSTYPERLRRTQEYTALSAAGLDREAITRRMGLTDAVGRSVYLDVKALTLLDADAEATQR